MRKLNDLHLSGSLSSCSLTITCADGTRRFIKYATGEQNGVETLQPTICQKESLKQDANAPFKGYCQCPQMSQNILRGENSQRFLKSNSKLKTSVNLSTPYTHSRYSDNDKIEKSPYTSNRRSNFSKEVDSATRKEYDPDTNGSCGENTYANLLDRFNLMKERISKSPEKGDSLLEKDSCFILEEENRKINSLPCKCREDQNISNCSQNTEQIMKIKVNGPNLDYIKETFIERSTFTNEGILTTTRHIMEKYDKNDEVHEVKDLNRMAERSHNTNHTASASCTPKQSSCREDPRNDANIKIKKDKNRQSYKNMIESYRNKRLGTKQKSPNLELHTQNGLRTSDSGISTVDRTSALPSAQLTNTSKPSAQTMSTPDEQTSLPLRQMYCRNSIRSQNNSSPIMESSLNTPYECNTPKECCSCIRQLCERHITQLLSLPENGLNPKMLSKLLIQDNEGRTRIDYFLVGKLLRNQSGGVVNIGKHHREHLNDVSAAEYHESQCMSHNQDDSGKVYRSELLEDVFRTSYNASTKSSVSNLSYKQDNGTSSLNDITRASYCSEQVLYPSHSFLLKKAVNVPFKSSKNSPLVAEVVVPNTFNCELLEGLDTYTYQQTSDVTDQCSEEEFVEILSPTHKVFVESSMQSVYQNGKANESIILDSAAQMHKRMPLSNRGSEHDIKLPRCQEKQCKNVSDNKFNTKEEKLPYSMESRRQNKFSLYDSDRRDLNGGHCSEYVNVMVPNTLHKSQPKQIYTSECSEDQNCYSLPSANKICGTEPTCVPKRISISMQSYNAQDNKEDPKKLSNMKSLDVKKRHRYSSGQDRCECCDQAAQNFCSIIEGYCQKQFSNEVSPNERFSTVSDIDDQRNVTDDFTNTPRTRSRKSELLKEVIISNDFGCCAPTCLDKGIQVYCCEMDIPECTCTDNQVKNNFQEYNDGPSVSYMQYNTERSRRESNDEKRRHTIDNSCREIQQTNSSFEPRVNLDQISMKKALQGEQSQEICDEVHIKVVASSDKMCMCEDQQPNNNQSTLRSSRVSFGQNDNTCVQNEQYHDICDEFRTDNSAICRDEQQKNTSDQLGFNTFNQNKQDSNSNNNTGHNQQTIQPIVIPIMCYIPMPSICKVCFPYHNTQSCCSVNVSPCNLQCCTPHPAINYSYPCQCCEPQSCNSHQICSCDVQSCDPRTSTCFPYQSCDLPCCDVSQLQYCCPQPPSIGTTSCTCCDPQTCCCMPCCDPQLKCLTLQIGKPTHGDKSSHRSHGKKSKDRKKSYE